MTWTKIGDTFPDAMLDVSRDAKLLHVEALVWCNRMGTDGAIPNSAALWRLGNSEDPGAAAAELVAAGHWTQVGDAYAIPDFLEDQPSAAEVRQRVAGNRDRQRRFNERKAAHAVGDHSRCDPRFCPKAAPNALSNALHDALITASRPDPSRPVPNGRDRDRVPGDGSPGGSPAPAPTGKANHPVVALADIGPLQIRRNELESDAAVELAIERPDDTDRKQVPDAAAAAVLARISEPLADKARALKGDLHDCRAHQEDGPCGQATAGDTDELGGPWLAVVCDADTYPRLVAEAKRLLRKEASA